MAGMHVHVLIPGNRRAIFRENSAQTCRRGFSINILGRSRFVLIFYSKIIYKTIEFSIAIHFSSYVMSVLQSIAILLHMLLF